MNGPTASARVVSPSNLAQTLLACLKQPGGAEPVRATLDATRAHDPLTPLQIRIAFSKAGRLAGDAQLTPKTEQLPIPCPLEGWNADQLARLAVLLGTIERVPLAEQVSLVETLYRTGGEREQQSVVRALSYLPQPERYSDLAAEATRTNAVTVFAALACENAFPAAQLPELNFNQMVLKAIFLEVDTGRILNLPARATPELVRMLQDYAAERRAAGRRVPADVDRITELATQ